MRGQTFSFCLEKIHHSEIPPSQKWLCLCKKNNKTLYLQDNIEWSPQRLNTNRLESVNSQILGVKKNEKIHPRSPWGANKMLSVAASYLVSCHVKWTLIPAGIRGGKNDIGLSCAEGNARRSADRRLFKWLLMTNRNHPAAEGLWRECDVLFFWTRWRTSSAQSSHPNLEASDRLQLGIRLTKALLSVVMTWIQ